MRGDRVVIIHHMGEDGTLQPLRVLQVWSRTDTVSHYAELLLDFAPLSQAEALRCDYAKSCGIPGERWRDPATGRVFCQHHRRKFDATLPENSGAVIAAQSTVPAQSVGKERHVEWAKYTGLVAR